MRVGLIIQEWTMTKTKIGLVVMGLLGAVACGDSGDGESGDSAGTNTGGGDTAGMNATNTGDSAGSNGDSAGANGANGANGGSGNASNGATSGNSNATAGDGDGGTTGGEGACTNDADVAAFEAISDPGMTAQNCALGSFTGTPIKDCYDKDPGFSKLSAGCRDCWSGVTQCVNDQCVKSKPDELIPSGPCSTDRDANTEGPCEKCREEKCDGPFGTCSGIDSMM